MRTARTNNRVRVRETKADGEEADTAWDEAYKRGEYKKHWHYTHPSQELATLLATSLPKKGDSLDVGCGAGVEAVFLARAGFKSHGVDISPRAIQIAKKRARQERLKVDFRVGSALQLPFPGSTFSFVNDRGCLHNLELEQWKRYSSEVARVARPNALFLLRGADIHESRHQFTQLSETRLQRYFGKTFSMGQAQHYVMVSDAGTLRSLVTVLKRKPD